jgi:hypothetical protein
LVVVITATPAAELSMSNPPTPLLPAATNTPLALILPPTSTPVPEVRIVTATPSPTTTLIDVEVPLNQAGNNAAARETTSQSAAAETASSAVDEGASSSGLPTFSSGGQAALTSSDNQYDLIPIKGGRDPRPAEEHGDLNLRLREPEPSQAAAELVDYTGFDDDNAPRLSAIFEPNFSGVYTVHDWDWDCNCPGPLKTDGFLVAIETTPGEPIYIPKVNSDIYGGKYYAVVLYASEDSLTFVYNDVGTVADAYAVHYLGLNVDPNLLQTYRESSGDELPALTLDTPVGTANEQIIVSMRDKGTFMDTRSRKDWWD